MPASAAIRPARPPVGAELSEGARGIAVARVSIVGACDFLLSPKPTGAVGHLPTPGASERFDDPQIGGYVVHNGIGSPLNIPSGLPGSDGGRGKFGLRGVTPTGEEVQFPKRSSSEF